MPELLRKGHFLGAKLRGLRKANGLTLEEVSVRCIQRDAAVGPSVSYLSMIESGKRSPSTQLLSLLAAVFQRAPAWFLDENADLELTPGGSGKGAARVPLEPAFLFSKTLRRTPRCIQLNADVETTRQRLADLEAQRRQLMGRGDRSYQDDIIRELARNGCGQQYMQEARRRDASHNPFASFFGDEDNEGQRGNPNQFGNLPFATYRTLCVRLCDGYYFPVSFSTLPNHFGRDAELCQSQCAAPAELFYHQNPGGAVEQMVSASTQQPYTNLKSAWRYRKEFVQGCSCKASEYVQQPPGERKAEASTAPPLPAAAPLNPR